MTHSEHNTPDKHHFGSRLRAARETKQLSVTDIGARLRLNPDIIQILESGNYRLGPPAIFMRGYLRSYAKLLDFPEKDILVALTDTGLIIDPDAPLVANLKSSPADPSPKISNLHWISMGMLLTLAFIVFVWWNAYPVTLVRGLFSGNAPSTTVQSVQTSETRHDGNSRSEAASSETSEAPLILPNSFGVLPDMTDPGADS